MSRTTRKVQPHFQTRPDYQKTWTSLGYEVSQYKGRMIRLELGRDTHSQTPLYTHWSEGKPKGWPELCFRWNKQVKRIKSKAQRQYNKQLLKEIGDSDD